MNKPRAIHSLAKSVVASSLCAFVFTMGACDDDDDDDDVGVDISRPDAGGDAAGADGPRDTAGDTALALTSDAQVLGVMIEANTGEVMAGELARTRAQSAPVVMFANTMVTDHTAANQRANMLATGLGLQPVESQVRAMLRAQATSVMNMLTSITDPVAFEAAYMASQVEMHAMVLALIDQQLLPVAQTADLRAELMTMRTAVSMHLTQARSLVQTLDGGAGGGDGGADAASQ